MSLLTAALGALVAVGAVLGPTALLAAVMVAQAAFLQAWFRVLEVPQRRLGVAIGLAAAAAADLLLLPVGGSPDPAVLGPLIGVVAAAILVAVLAQLGRGGGREGLTASLTATVSAAVLVVGGALWLTPRPGVVLCAGVASVAGVLAAALPGPRWGRAAAAAGAGAATGAALAAATGASVTAGGWVGVAAGTVAATGVAAAAYAGFSAAPALRASAASAGRPAVRPAPGLAALPVLLGGPVVVLVGRAVGGAGW